MKIVRRRGLSALALCAAAFLLGSSAAFAQTKTFTLDPDFDSGTLDNVVHNPANQLVLGPTVVSKTHTVWATNYLYGYVVKLDTVTGKQIGRYDSALLGTGARPVREFCDFATTGNCPGRVAVDAMGDAWIVNRAFGHQGTVTKIAGDLSHCIDRNNDTIIETSVDTNNDGIIDTTSGTEFLGQNDECVLATFPVGPNNVYPRSVSVDKNGKIWVGTFQDGKMYRYNPITPYALEATVTVGGNPYSSATGGDFVIVSNASAGGTKRININTLAVTSAACPATYGIVANPSGAIAWLGGYFTGNGVYKADFTAGTCTNIATGSTITAVTLDQAGNVWAAGYNTNTVHKISSAGALIGTFPAGGGNPHGLATDFQGNIWTVLHTPPSMSKINATTGALIGTYTIAGTGIPNADPYLYGDYTGVQIDRQAPYSYSGSWDGTFDGLVAGIPWSTVTWNTEAAGTVPALTTLTVSVRAADTLPGLAVATYTATTNAAALAGVIGRYVQVKTDLVGPGWLTPVVSDITVTGPCGTPGETCCLVDADCSDGIACTTDTCSGPGGSCVHTPIDECCAVDTDCKPIDQCHAGSCDAQSHTCTNVPSPDGTACDDGTACTQSDACGAGTCAGIPVVCTPSDQCHVAGTCDPGTGTCSNPIAADGTPCDDGNACTYTETCQSGLCGTFRSVGCNDNNPCTDDSCDPATGCVHTNNTIPCDDGNACTTADTCGGGSCQGGPALTCNDNNPCTDDTCDQANGCVFTDNNAPCSDGNACTTGDLCGGGTCSGGPAPNCNDNNPCTDDSCDQASGCVHVNNTAPCNDGNACTTADQCGGGGCHGGPPLSCDDNNPCTNDSCIPFADCVGTGCVVGCVHINNANPCTDGNACTGGDVCGGGVCHPGGSVVCNDNNACTTDTCDPASGCVFTNNTNPCDDRNVCTTNDTCGGGSCHGGLPLDCNDNNPCTNDSCDPGGCVGAACVVGGGCVHVNNTSPCNDGNACTTNDTCGGGTCNGGPASNCNDNNPCTDDSCNPSSGCVNTNNTSPCDDGNACTTNDTCGGGTCHGGPAPNCNDNNPCTDDSCNPSSGCVNANNSSPCSDGNACTTGDVCGGGTCHAGGPTNCNDTNPCTDDSCNPSSGCVNANNTAPCSDGNACTTGDVCGGGTCHAGGPTNCDDGQCCTIDSCNPSTGCAHVANTAAPVFTTQPSFGDKVLWPPQHGYADLSVAGTGAAASSSCGIASYRFASCSSSQIENTTGVGDGNTIRDCVYEPGALHVRAERDGACSPIGRVYTTTVVATDVCGNSTTSNAFDIGVWHDRGHAPASGTVIAATAGSNTPDTRNGTNGTYGTGCGAGSSSVNGTSHDHSDADPDAEVDQFASVDVNSLALTKSGGNVGLAWTQPTYAAPVNVTRYHIYRLDPVTLFWTMIAEVSKQTTSFQDPILNDGRSWQYRVTAVIK